MTNEERQIFVCRISQANRTQLIVIMQEIFLCYTRDAMEAYQNKAMEAFHESMQKARNCILQLRCSLDLENAVAKTIYPIYNYCDQVIAKADIKENIEHMDVVQNRMQRLHDSFESVSKQDDSEPLMSNTQTVYAGLTYGKFQLNEDIWDTSQRKRGYLV